MIKACLAGAAALICATGSLAACSTTHHPGKVVTVTVTPSPTATPTAPASSTTSVAASTSPTGTPTPAALTHLSGTCDDVLSDYDLSQDIGNEQLRGRDQFVVGVPEKDIGRLAYLNCRYGVTGTGASATAKVELGVSLYSSPAKAAVRLSATRDDYTAHGATATPATVAGHPAVWLTGGKGTDYAAPLLVVVARQRTAAVSLTSAVATGNVAQKYAAAIATTALSRSA